MGNLLGSSGSMKKPSRPEVGVPAQQAEIDQQLKRGPGEQKPGDEIFTQQYGGVDEKIKGTPSKKPKPSDHQYIPRDLKNMDYGYEKKFDFVRSASISEKPDVFVPQSGGGGFGMHEGAESVNWFAEDLPEPPKSKKGKTAASGNKQTVFNNLDNRKSLFYSGLITIKAEVLDKFEGALHKQSGNLDYISDEVAIDNLDSKTIEEKELKPKKQKHTPETEQQTPAGSQLWVIESFKPSPPGVGKDDPRRMIELRSLQLSGQNYKQTDLTDSDEEQDGEIDGSVETSVLLIYMECKEEGKLFTDEEFPPQTSSVVGSTTDGLHLDEIDKLKTLVWRRPKQIFPDRLRSVCKEISAKQISQGIIGDCYLLAALACLAQKPSRIQRILHVRRSNKVGVYAVNLCIHSIWETVLLDDSLPCLTEGKLAFASSVGGNSNQNQLWPMLIEKAWAKVHGGYSRINEGLIDEALHDLTGAPTSYVFIKDHNLEAHWNILSEALDKGFLVACGTRDFYSTNHNQVEQSMGLVPGHAYSILGCFEITDDQGEMVVAKDPEQKGVAGNQRVLRLFNPWSRRGQYKGDWSDSYQGWTPRLRKELLQTESSNSKGIFYISLESFIKYFYSYVVCYYHDDFQYSSEKFESSPTEPSVVSFEVSKAGEYYITVSQINSRMFRDADNYSYSNVAIIVARVKSDGSYEYKGSINKLDKDVWVKVDCKKAGKYICCILTPWQSLVKEFGFSIYGPASVAEVQRHNAPGDMMQDYVTQLGILKARKKIPQLKKFDGLGHPDIGFLVEHDNMDLGYIFFDNNSADTQLTANIIIKESKNTIFYPAIKKNRFEVVVSPGRQKIIVYQMCGQAAKLRFQERFHFVSDFKKNSQFVKSKGTRIPRLLPGDIDTGIALYTLAKDDIQILYYENASESHYLSEILHLGLQNAKIAASDSNSIIVDLKPGKSRYIVIRRSNPSQQLFGVELQRNETSIFLQPAV